MEDLGVGEARKFENFQSGKISCEQIEGGNSKDCISFYLFLLMVSKQ